ncbi:hypothetical protein HYW21_06485 [Candidatus Woesearchaeota archaeon]|nr:hypothetical protein [Candidatus Woesearchaeota archaeon]
METIAVWENYLKGETLLRNRGFTNKLIYLLQSKIASQEISGAFYTFYTHDLQQTHIKVGLLINEDYDESNIKQEIANLINDNLSQQSDTRKDILFCPTKIEKTTGIIACWAFDLLKIVRDKNNQDIAEVYRNIFWRLSNSFGVKRDEILINFGQFKQKYPRYFLSQFLLSSILEKEIIDSYIIEFCKKIKDWIEGNVLDKKEIWFLCDRLFHHCNNSNNKFGFPRGDEYEILEKLISKIQNG